VFFGGKTGAKEVHIERPENLETKVFW